MTTNTLDPDPEDFSEEVETPKPWPRGWLYTLDPLDPGRRIPASDPVAWAVWMLRSGRVSASSRTPEGTVLTFFTGLDLDLSPPGSQPPVLWVTTIDRTHGDSPNLTIRSTSLADAMNAHDAVTRQLWGGKGSQAPKVGDLSAFKGPAHGADEQEQPLGPYPPHQVRFVEDMRSAGLKVFHYEGRHFYQGPAVRVHERETALRATDVPCQWDNLGLEFVVYPI
jgi:hypothetical protein